MNQLKLKNRSKYHNRTKLIKPARVFDGIMINIIQTHVTLPVCGHDNENIKQVKCHSSHKLYSNTKNMTLNGSYIRCMYNITGGLCNAEVRELYIKCSFSSSMLYGLLHVHFLSFFINEMVVHILPHGRSETFYLALLIALQMITWRHKATGHQQPRYCASLPGLFRSPNWMD